MFCRRSLSVLFSIPLVSSHIVQAQAIASVAAPSSTPATPRVITRAIDPKAQALLQAAFNRLGRAKTLTGEIRMETYSAARDSQGAGPSGVEVTRFEFLQPGYLHTEAQHVPTNVAAQAIQATQPNPQRVTVTVLTPERGWRYVKRDSMVDSLDPTVWLKYSLDPLVHAFFTLPSRRFESGEWSPERMTALTSRSARVVGRETWQGTSYDVVEWVAEHDWSVPKDTLVWTMRVYLETQGADTMVRRIVATSSRGVRVDRQLTTVAIDRPVSAAAFVLPATAEHGRPFVLRPPRPSQYASLVGAPLPEFGTDAVWLDGPRVRKADLLQGKRAVVFWPWTYGCTSCREEFPLYEQLAREWAAKGVAVVVANYSKKREDAPNVDMPQARQMRAFNGATMPILYWSGLPTHCLVVDRTGNVVYEDDQWPNFTKLRTILAQLTS